MKFSLDVFGTFALRCDGRPIPPPSTAKARAVLTYLALRRERALTREVLADTFWPELDPERARGNLKTALWAIRRALSDGGCDPNAVLTAERTNVQWNAAIEIDAEILDRADPNDSEDRNRAIKAYGGDFLESDYSDWALAERERLSLRYESLLSREVEESRDPALAETLLARDPYHEKAYQVLVTDALEHGNRRAALAFYGRAVAALQEIGARPSGELARVGPTLAVRQPVSGRFRLPFVGRQRERDAIDDAIARSKERDGSCIVIWGPPGIGKSALLDTVEASATEAGVRVNRVRASEADAETYGPWRDFYATHLGKPFDDIDGRSREVNARTLARELVHAITSPAALLVDNLQFFTDDALALTIEISRMLVQRGDLAILTSRPEGRERVEALKPFESSEFELGPLAGDEIEAAIRRAGGKPLAELETLLKERTQGHPLFMVSLCAELVHDGILHNDADAGGWTLKTQAASRRKVPKDVRTLYDRRLRERGEQTRRVATVLALEPELGSDDIAAILDVDEEHVLDALDDLLALAILEERPNGPPLQFVHDVVREVALGSIAKSRSAALHRRIADRLQLTKHAGSQARRAEHLLAAGEHFDGAGALLAATKEALRVGGRRDAFNHIAAGLRALDSCDDSVDVRVLRADLEHEHGNALAAGVELDAAIQAYSNALRLAATFDDPVRRTRYYLSRSMVLTQQFGEGAISDAREAVRWAEASGDRSLRVSALLRLAAAHVVACNYAEALDAAERGYALATEFGLWDEAVKIASVAGDAAMRMGRESECAQWIERCFSAGRRAGTRPLLSARYLRATLCIRTHDLAGAKAEHAAIFEGLNALRTSSGELSVVDSRLWWCTRHGEALVARGERDWDALIRNAELLVEDPWGASSPEFQIYGFHAAILGYSARAREGDLERAEELLRAMPHSDSKAVSAEPARSRAAIAIARNSPDASELFDKALEASEGVESGGLAVEEGYDELKLIAEVHGRSDLVERVIKRAAALVLS